MIPSPGLSPWSEAPSAEELSTYPWNDWGNAMRLIRLGGGTRGDDGRLGIEGVRLLYLEGGGWIGFNGRYWDRQAGENLARRLAHETAQGLVEQVGCIDGDELKKSFRRFARESGNAGRTAAMLTQAAPYLTVTLDAFDRDPLAMTVRNGTLRLARTAGDGLEIDLRPHDPADRITRMADVDYAPAATSPVFERVLAHALPEPGLADFLQRAIGYGATGLTREQVWFMAQGKGRDSKSTLFDACRETLGGYAGVANVATFLDQGPRGGADASPDLARLAGEMRFVSIVEPQRGARLNEGLIKSWTSGAPIVARELRQSLFEFKPRGKLFMEVNSRPKVGNDDDGTWRRLLPIPFRHQVDPRAIDRTLPEQLRGEQSGILNWILQGVGDYLADGLSPPTEVLEVLDDYRRGSSPFGEWFTERVEVDPEAVTKAAHFYSDYKDWCEVQGIEKPISNRQFGDSLADRQIIRCRKDGAGNVLRKGARLRAKGWVEPASDLNGLGAGGLSSAEGMADRGASAAAGHDDDPFGFGGGR